MNGVSKKNNDPLKFPSSKKYEFYYFPALSILLFIPLLFGNEMKDDLFIPSFIIVLGLLHVLASNILTFAYNLTYVVLSIPFRLRPWFIKIVGILLILNAIRVVIME